MSSLSLEALKNLTQARDGWCVSLFMPTHRAGAETQQNPIRFKNLLTEAEDRLLENDLDTPDVRALLKPAQELLENNLFWQHQLDGLALFLAQGEPMHMYRVTLNLGELVVVGKRFHTKPLLPLLSGDGQFYVLALSQQTIRLLEGTRDSVSEVELEEVPQGIDEALWFEDPERRLQFHTATGSPSTGRPAVFYGHGVSTETNEKELILRYFHRVDKGIQALLAGEQAPLVLAGVDFLLPIYREANSYPHIIEEGGVTGSPENLSVEALHQKAWQVVRPIFTKAQQRDVDRYHQLAGGGRASNDLKQVIQAAHRGRVDVLFVAVDQHKWGAYDVQADRLEIFPPGEETSDRVDLLDLAATQALLNGGTVYALAAEDVPGDNAVAAIYRY